jgi:hypothetical protein
MNMNYFTRLGNLVCAHLSETQSDAGDYSFIKDLPIDTEPTVVVVDSQPQPTTPEKDTGITDSVHDLPSEPIPPFKQSRPIKDGIMPLGSAAFIRQTQHLRETVTEEVVPQKHHKRVTPHGGPHGTDQRENYKSERTKKKEARKQLNKMLKKASGGRRGAELVLEKVTIDGHDFTKSRSAD